MATGAKIWVVLVALTTGWFAFASYALVVNVPCDFDGGWPRWLIEDALLRVAYGLIAMALGGALSTRTPAQAVVAAWWVLGGALFLTMLESVLLESFTTIWSGGYGRLGC